jgi:hypothetical protein
MVMVLCRHSDLCGHHVLVHVSEQRVGEEAAGAVEAVMQQQGLPEVPVLTEDEMEL